jgi:signal transduction histidine kinase
MEEPGRDRASGGSHGDEAGVGLPVDAHIRAAVAAAAGVDVLSSSGRADGRRGWCAAVISVQAVCDRREIGWRAPLTAGGLRGLAEEQAALRRVATLVARGTPPAEVFAAVTEEVARLLCVECAIMNRYEPDGTITTIAGWGDLLAGFPAGYRESLGGENIVTLVHQTGRPARIGRYADSSSGAIGAVGRESGISSAVGAPIIVEGRLWGLLAVASPMPEPPLSADTETRLASFTELVATAIANAESRAGLASLAEEQAALRRVATLVARATPQEEVFATVTDEVVQLLRTDMAIMSRYELGGTVTAVARSGEPGEHLAVGNRRSLGGNNLATIVFETGCPARIDSYADVSGPLGSAVRAEGIRSAVGAPIVVEGRLWGLVAVASTRPQPPLSTDTEARLASFTELVATAIANAESHAALARLAEEQVALRQVATLVAHGASPEETFSAVSDEVGRLFGAEVAIARFEPGGSALVVVGLTRGITAVSVGSRWELEDFLASTAVYRTGRPARSDRTGYRDASGPIADSLRRMNLVSSVAAPIVVDGQLWGVMTVVDQRKPLPPDTEARLASFTELVATAIANAESRAALATSRARIVAAADESRRRIERDLHDGAQQRLVHAVITLKLALRAQANGDANASELVADGLRHAEQANSELRELAHGILPAALTRGGLRAGVEAVVSRVSLPVSVDVTVARLPAGMEATAYFVVSEALTNVVKHARADAAEVTARVEEGQLRVEVRDDGVGGARGDHTTGLGGLEDRVSALGGRLVVDSPPGGGTRVCALLPVSHASGLDELGPARAVSTRE